MAEVAIVSTPAMLCRPDILGLGQWDAEKRGPTAYVQVATRCREMFGPSLSCLFKASVFQMFEQDADGCISGRHFLMYLSLRAAMIQMVGARLLSRT